MQLEDVLLWGLKVPFVVFALTVVIIVLFLYQGIALWLTAARVEKRLESVLSNIKQYGAKDKNSVQRITSVERQAIGEIFKQDVLLGEAWKEFDETLVTLPDSGPGNTATSAIVYNTQQAEVYFKRETIADSLDLLWYNSVPGILTGFGLLGTFTALLIGLAALNVKQDMQVVGIDGLINGLSGKFVSSIAGLLSSLVFLFFEKWQVRSVERKFIRLQRLLNGLFERKPIEQLLIMLQSELSRKPQEDTLREVVSVGESQRSILSDIEGTSRNQLIGLHRITEFSERQADRLGELTGGSGKQTETLSSLAENAQIHGTFLKALSDEIAEGRLNEHLSRISERAEAQQTSLEMLATDLATKLTSGIQQSVTPELQRMVAAIEKLNETTEALRQQRQESSTDVLERLAQSFKESLTSSANTEMQQLGQSMAKAATFLDNLDHKNQEMESRMVQLFGNLDDTIRLQREQASQQSAAVEQLMERLLEQTQTVASEQVSQFHQQIENVLGEAARRSVEMQQGFNAMIEHMRSASSSQQSNLQQQVAAVSSSMQELLTHIEANATRSAQSLEQNSRNTLATTERQIEQALADSAQRSSQMRTEFAVLVEQLQNTSNTQQANLQRQAEGLSATMQNLLGRIETNATHSSQALEENIRSVLAATQQWLDGAAGQIKQLLEQQRSQVQFLNTATQGVQSGVEAFNRALGQNTEYFGQLQKVTGSIESAAASFDRTSTATGESQRQLQQGIAGLQQALRDNGTLLETSRRVVERQREVYEQIDTQLGRLLSQLTTSFDTFADATQVHLTSNLKQFDNHLSGATQLLGASVSELGDQLEELGNALAQANGNKR